MCKTDKAELGQKRLCNDQDITAPLARLYSGAAFACRCLKPRPAYLMRGELVIRSILERDNRLLR